MYVSCHGKDWSWFSPARAEAQRQMDGVNVFHNQCRGCCFKKMAGV